MAGLAQVTPDHRLRNLTPRTLRKFCLRIGVVWIPLQLLGLKDKVIGVLCAGVRQDGCAPGFEPLTNSVVSPRDGRCNIRIR